MPELSQEKIFKYLTAVLSLLTAVLLVREIFFGPDDLSMPGITFPITEVNVRTEVFDEFNIKGLTPFTIEELAPFESIILPEIVGREAPFEPYSIEEYNAALEALYSTSSPGFPEGGEEASPTTTIPTSTTTEETATTTED